MRALPKWAYAVQTARMCLTEGSFLDVRLHFTIFPSTFRKHSNKQAKYEINENIYNERQKVVFFLTAGLTLNVCPDKQAEFGSLISYAGSSLESVMRMLIFVLITERPARVLILLSCVPPTLLLGNMDANCQHVNWNYSPSN